MMDQEWLIKALTKSLIFTIKLLPESEQQENNKKKNLTLGRWF